VLVADRDDQYVIATITPGHRGRVGVSEARISFGKFVLRQMCPLELRIIDRTRYSDAFSKSRKQYVYLFPPTLCAELTAHRKAHWSATFA
jgi:hypothetical protein